MLIIDRNAGFRRLLQYILYLQKLGNGHQAASIPRFEKRISPIRRFKRLFGIFDLMPALRNQPLRNLFLAAQVQGSVFRFCFSLSNLFPISASFQSGVECIANVPGKAEPYSVIMHGSIVAGFPVFIK